MDVDDAAREVECVGAFVDEDGVGPLRDDRPQHAERAVVVHRHVIVDEARRHLRDIVLAFLDDGADPFFRRAAPIGPHTGEQRGHA